MFYLTTHSTHFIYGYRASEKKYKERKPFEGISVIFNTVKVY